MNRTQGIDMLKKALDTGPFIIIIFAFILSVLAMLALLIVDVVTGEITSDHVLANAPSFFRIGLSWFVSLATSGALIATFGIGIKGYRERWKTGYVFGLLVVGILIQVADFYADMRSVDIMRFGAIVYPKEVLSSAEATTHNVYRALIGTISLFGEPLAAASVAIFPELKSLLDGLMGVASRTPQTNLRPTSNQPGGHVRPKAPVRPSPVSAYPPANPQQPRQTSFSRNEPTYHPVGQRDNK